MKNIAIENIDEKIECIARDIADGRKKLILPADYQKKTYTSKEMVLSEMKKAIENGNKKRYYNLMRYLKQWKS